VGPTPTDPTPRLRQLAALEVDGGTVLVGVVEGSTREGAAVAEVYRAEDSFEVTGSAVLARRFERLRGEQSGVQGPVRFIPLPEGVLALQASYEAPEQGFGVPRLTDVAVGWGEAIGNGPVLAAALDGARVGGPPQMEDAALRASARRWYERMEAARRSGDWAAFGRAYEELGRLLTAGPDTAR
jgi:uncharacterized membrane protein (UPF0182 family)